MKNPRNLVNAAAISIFLISLAFAQKVFAEEPVVPDGKVLVYFYMPPGAAGTSISIMVLTKDGPVAVLSQGDFSTYVADPGSTKFWPFVNAPTSADHLTPITVDLVVGQVFYVKVGATSFFGGKLLSVVDPKKAKGEVANCQELK